MINKKTNMTFDEWYEILQNLASGNDVSVADEDAWREEWEAGKWPEDAFYEEYPEYREQ